jgi:hypothetical protein
MTLAEKFREEGREEGREQGRLQEVFRIVCRVLEIRFGALPEGLSDVLDREQEPSRLEHLFDAAIQCGSLEAFAALL